MASCFYKSAFLTIPYLIFFRQGADARHGFTGCVVLRAQGSRARQGSAAGVLPNPLFAAKRLEKMQAGLFFLHYFILAGLHALHLPAGVGILVNMNVHIFLDRR